jgi:hypothetical protein
MSSGGYKALLQSLEENDVSRGLGRPVALRKGKRSGCCRRCFPWFCLVTVILTGLVLSIGIPVLMTLPADSPYHWRRWLPERIIFWSHPHRADGSAEDGFDPSIINGTAVDVDGDSSFSILGNHTEPVFPDLIQEADRGEGADATLIERTMAKMREMISWSREQYEKMPKIPLIIGLSSLLLVIISLIWLVIYRRVVRNQRRRKLGKLVTDLQSGDNSLLLNSDDSDED